LSVSPRSDVQSSLNLAMQNALQSDQRHEHYQEPNKAGELG